MYILFLKDLKQILTWKNSKHGSFSKNVFSEPRRSHIALCLNKNEGAFFNLITKANVVSYENYYDLKCISKFLCTVPSVMTNKKALTWYHSKHSPFSKYKLVSTKSSHSAQCLNKNN